MKTLTLTTFESLPVEQIKKRKVSVADYDISGMVKRHHVMDQTLFDHLLIVGLIDAAEHEASHCFMDLMSCSGMYISSANLEIVSPPSYHVVGGLMGLQRMAFSNVYRKVASIAGEIPAKYMMRIFADPIRYSKVRAHCEDIMERLRPALTALCRIYRTRSRVDPRRVIRRQLGSVVEKYYSCNK